jgi:hypothetical protein
MNAAFPCSIGLKTQQHNENIITNIAFFNYITMHNTLVLIILFIIIICQYVGIRTRNILTNMYLVLVTVKKKGFASLNL